MTDAEKLQYLLDRAEIHDVVVRYALAIDMRDWALYATCFTDEVEMDLTELRDEGDNPRYEKYSRADWVKLVTTLERYKATQHVNTNFTIAVEGDEATCVSYIHAQLYAPDGRVESTWEIIGYYTWDLARTPDGWRIRRVKEWPRWLAGARSL